MANSNPDGERTDAERRRVTLDRLARSIATDSWFAAVGEPLIDAERDEARLYLDGLGFKQAGIVGIGDWVEARNVADAPDWDPAWWAAEEQARDTLLNQAESAIHQKTLYEALSTITTVASETVHGKAAIAAARGGIADAGLIRSAAGAASMACYHAALAKAACAGDDHPFAAKYRLFAAGRWPLAINEGILSVF
jgi:hypothetical protein